MAVLLALLVVAAGCGSSSGDAPPAHAAKAPSVRCTHPSGGFRACTVFSAPGERSAIYRRLGSGWVILRGRLTGQAGWWRRVVAAPDRRTVLAQWSGECELQSTYLVSATDGSVRAPFGTHATDAVGWTPDGLARVRLAEQVWRGGTLLHRPGIYLVDPRSLTVKVERLEPAVPGC